jgi:AbrB family transcriptional regulator (stage V sporulation protein T)
MKATGIVRRIDDLGRVAIPKEIRRNMSIHEGDPLEIFTDDNGIVLQKYNVGEHIADALRGVMSDIHDSLCTSDIERDDKTKVLSLLKEATKILDKE